MVLTVVHVVSYAYVEMRVALRDVCVIAAHCGAAYYKWLFFKIILINDGLTFLCTFRCLDKRNKPN